MTEAYTTLENMIRFYGTETTKGAQIPFNFELISNTNRASTAKEFEKRIMNWLNLVPAWANANWVVS